ncbi:MAG: sigma-70 family RNA polymerase sigma factor [Dissulfurispiraceae bacterium]
MLNADVKSTTVARGSGPPPVLPVKRGRKSWKDRIDGAIQVALGINLSTLEMTEPRKKVQTRKKTSGNKAEQLELDLFHLISEKTGIPTEELQKDREFVLDRNRPENVDLAIEKLDKFIKAIAYKFVRSGVYFNDLVEQGRIGVWEAFEKFDADQNCSFFTWAIYKIRWAMLGLIKDPDMRYSDASLDEEFDDSGCSLHEVIPAPEPRTSVHNEILLREIWQYVDRLPEKLRKFAHLRFNPDDELTLQEIGDALGFSKQNAEQTEKKVIALLKSMILDAKVSQV